MTTDDRSSAPPTSTSRPAAPPAVAVVGAGLAGAACASALVRAGVAVVLHERSHRPGGRMASPVIDGRVTDTGASYLTVSGDGPHGFGDVVRGWVERGLARPWTDAFPVVDAGGAGEPSLSGPKQGPVRYAAPQGLRSLVADLVDQAAAGPGGLEVRWDSEVTTVAPGPRVDGQDAAAVVLAMPDPQALRLLDPALEAERAVLAGHEWEPVLALVARWEQRTWPDLDGAFVSDDDVLGWVADDGRRRGDDAPVLVAHSTSLFAAQYLDDPEAAAPAMVAALDRLLGTGSPLSSTVRRWTFARPVGRRDEAFHLGGSGVGLAGDGWGSPKVQTAWESGDALGRALAQRLQGQPVG